jgi:ankyrin repeat protein
MAVHQDDIEMIDLLLKCGAHLSSVETKSIAELLSLAARGGAVTKLQSLKRSGADLDTTDELRQSPLHKVAYVQTLRFINCRKGEIDERE